MSDHAPSIHYMYILSDSRTEQDGYVKVGESDDLYSRYGPYATSRPGTVEHKPHYLYYFRVSSPSTKDHARAIERAFRARYDKYATDNEWYHMPKEMAKEALISMGCVEILIPQRQSNQVTRAPRYEISADIQSEVEHSAKLSLAQEEPITQMTAFLRAPNDFARILSAPCGFGKTRITVEAINRAGIDHKSVAVCAPSLGICEQWRAVLPSAGMITTFISAWDKLHDKLAEIRVIIFDEAHHMAGRIAADRSEGQTRELLKHITKSDLQIALGIKRIFLTFTPKHMSAVSAELPTDETFTFSMNNTSVFGTTIKSHSLVECIERKLLPDYRITVAHIFSDSICDEASSSEAPEDKCLKLKCREFARILNYHDFYSRDDYMIANALVFVKEVRDIHTCANFIREFLQPDQRIRIIEAHAETRDDDVAEFQKYAKLRVSVIRSSSDEPIQTIMISCRVLSEGINIPQACAVAVLYPKHSIIDITQMILRAGRWLPYKGIFHMIFPLLDEDYEAFESVLVALARHDVRIIADMARVCSRGIAESSIYSRGGIGSYRGGDALRTDSRLDVLVDTFGSQCEFKIHIHFSSIIEKVIKQRARNKVPRYYDVQLINRELGLMSHAEYEMARNRHPAFIENPQRVYEAYWVSWGDFLGLADREKWPKTKKDFMDLCQQNEVHNMQEYEHRRAIDGDFRARTHTDPTEMYADFTNFDLEIALARGFHQRILRKK